MMSSVACAESSKFIRAGNLCLKISLQSGMPEALSWSDEALLESPSLPSFSLEMGKDKFKPSFRLLSFAESNLKGYPRLLLEYQSQDIPGLKLIQEIKPGNQSDALLRSFKLQTSPDFVESENATVHNFKLALSGIGAGHWSQSHISVPMGRFLPDQVLSEVAQRARHITSTQPTEEFEDLGVAPDCGLGVVLLSAPISNLHFAVIPLAHECPVRSFVFGQDGRVAIEQEFSIELKLKAGQTYTLGSQSLLVVEGDRRRFLNQVAAIFTDRYPPPSDRSNWASNATVLEADFIHYGGIAKLTAKLPAIKNQGFDTVYLMPWHEGPFSGYGTLDYWQIDPAKGTFDELKALTSRAHELGLKVLFDLLVNMVMDNSPYLKLHPDWFYRDSAGMPQCHQVWPGFALDPASPGLRTFLRDYCLRCVGELGADGFRVDAVAYRGGNWNPLPGLQPHQHAHAIFSLLAEIRDDIKKAKPEAILMAECFGPAQVPISDLVCFQWVGWLDWILERLINGKFSGREVGSLLRDHFGCMPAGTWLTTYTHTHDTVAFQGREWDGLPVQTLFVTLSALSSATMTFGGGWSMRERPSEKETGLYQDLSSLRYQWGGIASDQVTFLEGPHRSLLVAERSSSIGRLRLTANFSDSESPWKPKGTRLFSVRRSNAGKLKPWDVVIENIS